MNSTTLAFRNPPVHPPIARTRPAATFTRLLELLAAAESAGAADIDDSTSTDRLFEILETTDRELWRLHASSCERPYVVSALRCCCPRGMGGIVSAALMPTSWRNGRSNGR